MSMSNSDETVRVSLILPLWVKELLNAAAESEGVAVSTLASHILVEGARDTIDIPKPPPAAAPIPTVTDVLRSYVEGSSRLIGPCGEAWPCEYDENLSQYIGDCEFCHHCNVRVR